MRSSLAALGAIAVTFAGAAWADIPPDDIDGCEGRAAGDECRTDDGRAGRCAQVLWGHDGSVEFLQCQEISPATSTVPSKRAAWLGAVMLAAAALGLTRRWLEGRPVGASRA